MSLQNITLAQGSGIPSVGTILSVSNLASPVVYNPIGNLGSNDWDMKSVTADTTNMGTAWKQHIITLLDGGQFTCDLFFVPDSDGQDGTSGIVGHSFTSPGALGAIFIGREVRNYSIDFPDGTTYFFDATIDDFPISANVEKPLMVKIKFGVTGEPTFS
jgi:hypothetical protein